MEPTWSKTTANKDRNNKIIPRTQLQWDRMNRYCYSEPLIRRLCSSTGLIQHRRNDTSKCFESTMRQCTERSHSTHTQLRTAKHKHAAQLSPKQVNGVLLFPFGFLCQSMFLCSNVDALLKLLAHVIFPDTTFILIGLFIFMFSMKIVSQLHTSRKQTCRCSGCSYRPKHARKILNVFDHSCNRTLHHYDIYGKGSKPPYT
jgi:hypothetical protein